MESVGTGAASCSLRAPVGGIGRSAVTLDAEHSQQHGKPMPADFLQEKGKAFKNSSEKQISLMPSSSGAEFCFFSFTKLVCPIQ